MRRKPRRRKVKRKRGTKTEGRSVQTSLRNKTFCYLISVAFLFVAGCGGGSPTAPVPPKAKPVPADAAKTAPAATAAKQPEKKEEVEYAYNPTGKPDPFKPFIQLSPVRESSRKAPLTPLQRYEVSQLKLVAIISTAEGNIALVEDSAGKGFFIKKGTLIGKSDGKVISILKDKVVIEELYQDVVGQTKKNEMTINLHQVEEGVEP
jgi:type IV pilus assembly protein PilP